jgi:hypothetical protein
LVVKLITHFVCSVSDVVSLLVDALRRFLLLEVGLATEAATLLARVDLAVAGFTTFVLGVDIGLIAVDLAAEAPALAGDLATRLRGVGFASPWFVEELAAAGVGDAADFEASLLLERVPAMVFDLEITINQKNC